MMPLAQALALEALAGVPVPANMLSREAKPIFYMGVWVDTDGAYFGYDADNKMFFGLSEATARIQKFRAHIKLKWNID